ncbi:MAG: SDR family NAD(P)-dependent oxidoreductase [Bacteroidales bacterium]|jgi:NAD(P)-dependent dehydrogenase (short-subunit alcohol dehydrogenase family)/rhamnose utilization protein RhaD (predicted bifunctional aldolase and dehydrogenase)|nr:SDR family NAD(P)-dependent oxidoreductase [Bacteroidales bacterium]
MKQQISDLIAVSRHYGKLSDYVIAGGGNTSYKDYGSIWVKASGVALGTLDEDGLVSLDRQKLDIISGKNYSDDPVQREEQVKNDLYAAICSRTGDKRPSVETSLHNLIQYRFVVHLHPTLINGVLCSRNARQILTSLFGETILFVPYIDPGYTLFKKMEEDILQYRSRHGEDPKMIFLGNHGTFVSADSTDEIREIYDKIISALTGFMEPLPPARVLPYNNVMHTVLPALRMMLSEDRPAVIRYRHNELIAGYYGSQQEFNKISLPLTPDIIVYCKARYLYIEQYESPVKILDAIRTRLPRFRQEYGFMPKVIIIKNMGLFAVEESAGAAETVLDVFEDMVKICRYSASCGGTKFMSADEIAFIDRWEVENYRRKVSKASAGENKHANRIAVVTGGAQGFGAGIAEGLAALSMNVVVADLNEEAGEEFAAGLKKKAGTARNVFVKADVSDPESVKSLIEFTVSEFGGVDLIVSNAGILRAGGLEEMEPDTFIKTTAVNYAGYFYCAKYASEVMKIQNNENPEHFTDIIQINSKSGLRGSNRNFAYAGAKFGGIGLTQSFALELAPHRIKVNSICPGNFYEGPLWSDPKNGLFVQYLNAGKVPGARTIDDVRRYYEEQVPLRRGCRLGDLMKALLYIVDQEYETGQAIPVTGGQVMLG